MRLPKTYDPCKGFYSLKTTYVGAVMMATLGGETVVSSALRQMLVCKGSKKCPRFI